MWRLLLLLLFTRRTTPRNSDSDAVQQAWKIHDALVDWTGKVDQKASFALALESAVAAGLIATSTDDGPLSGLSGWCERGPYWLGVGLFGLAIVLAVLTVLPNLRSKKIAAEAASNYIFFGHLREWSPADLERALVQCDLLPVLTRQLVAMSTIAWKKHRRLQGSLIAAGLGAVSICVAVAMEKDLVKHASSLIS